MAHAVPIWQPTEIRRFVANRDSGAGVLIVETDAGTGYLKAMGNPGGDHVLACEWVGTQLARWLGLQTLDFALIQVTRDDVLPFFRGGFASVGPAFITRKERGAAWSGTEHQLRRLVNPEDISRLVVFDTWTRNWDRHSPDGARINRDNVFLKQETKGRLLLKAIDHTHCFTRGHELTKRLANIEFVKDPGVYGLFPEFRPFLDRRTVKRAAKRLGGLQRGEVWEIMEGIPKPWEVDPAALAAFADFVVGRAAYLADRIEMKLFPQLEMFSGDSEG